MSGARPIETRYRGCRFRSRLEARWAVFFDALGVRWEYEPQGFELPDVGRYLPDFYLPDECFWVEVKPATSSHSPDWTKAGTLARERRVPVAVVVGQPEFGWRERRDFTFDERGVLVVSFLGRTWDMPVLHAAAEKATSARFEFGESG